MNFLQLEVENEQRISMIVQGFNLKIETEKDSRGSTEKLKKYKERSDVTRASRATGLLTTKTREKIVCVFCAGEHRNFSCEKFWKMNLEDRQNMFKKKYCLNCLKIGYECRKCKVDVKCAWCGKRHVVLMCPELSSKEETTKKIESVVQTYEESNLVNLSRVPDVFL